MISVCLCSCQKTFASRTPPFIVKTQNVSRETRKRAKLSQNTLFSATIHPCLLKKRHDCGQFASIFLFSNKKASTQRIEKAKKHSDADIMTKPGINTAKTKQSITSTLSVRNITALVYALGTKKRGTLTYIAQALLLFAMFHVKHHIEVPRPQSTQKGPIAPQNRENSPQKHKKAQKSAKNARRVPPRKHAKSFASASSEGQKESKRPQVCRKRTKDRYSSSHHTTRKQRPNIYRVQFLHVSRETIYPMGSFLGMRFFLLLRLFSHYFAQNRSKCRQKCNCSRFFIVSRETSTIMIYIHQTATSSPFFVPFFTP